MASGTIYATIPAIVAAAGIYFFDRNHSKSKERGGGIRAAIDKLVAKAKEEEKTTRAPKFAPQFDGLHCFELWWVVSSACSTFKIIIRRYVSF